jgi:hypothetical protein
VELIRDRITIAEMSQLDPKHKKALDNNWDDPMVGEYFFIKGTDVVRVITDMSWGNEKGERPDDTYYFYEENGQIKSVNWDDCLPIFNTAQMIDILSFEHDFHISSLRGKWLIQVDGSIYQTEDRDICGLLWQATKEYLSGRIY